MVSSQTHKLVGDIGGTNARFALLDSSNKPMPKSAETLATADFPDMASAIRHFMGKRSIKSLTAASLAVATRVSTDDISFTNNRRWSFSIDAVKRSLDIDQLHILNDFTALALSVPHLSENFLVQCGGKVAVPDSAIAVIGPGTGLGVSGLLPDGKGGWFALHSEGGHTSAACHTDREIAVYQRLRSLYGHVSAERFLSGPGLVLLHDALRVIDGQAPRELLPAEITDQGLANTDSYCRETLSMFCALLGLCAGNLAITLGATGGVFIGGGIVPKLGQFFHDSEFRARFDEKGRVSNALLGIPVFVITEPYPALTGAAQLL